MRRAPTTTPASTPVSPLANHQRERVRALLGCPGCHGALDWHEDRAACGRCARAYPFERGLPRFHDVELPETRDASFQADQMFNQGIAARLYNLGKRLVNSEYKQRDPVAEAVTAAPAGQVIVELGSGNRRLREDVINVELFPFPNVDVLADVATTPFADASIDLVILDSLIEHVPEAHMVIAEVKRILRPGGRAVCVVPFVFPYHGYPKHYCNFTADGLRVLFRGFSRCDVETCIGPTAALTNLVSEYVAVAAAGSSKLGYTVVKGLGLLPIFFLKYLDRLWDPARSQRLASMLAAVAVR